MSDRSPHSELNQSTRDLECCEDEREKSNRLFVAKLRLKLIAMGREEDGRGSLRDYDA